MTKVREKKNIKVLSLFANIGVAEAFLEKIGVDVVLANEIDPKRAEIYKSIYPDTEMVCGDIQKKETINILCKKSKEIGVNLIMATPPCQGMSTTGKQDKNDHRNNLIQDAVEVVKKVKPKYVFIENVPMLLLTKIRYKDNDVLIQKYLDLELSNDYYFKISTINMSDYGVPQSRDRVIFLLTRKDISNIWDFPKKEKKRKTLFDAIGHLPSLDPLIYDVDYQDHLKIFPKYEQKKANAKLVSKFHTPPRHVYRQVVSMRHTPTGKTAFDNKDKYKPMKKDGSLVKGFKNTYKRQSWDVPAYTVTMYNRTIGSQNNVHPGIYIGDDAFGDPLYSDPRVLTVYELMIIMTLPKNWNLPDNLSESFIRSLIGEGVPPLFIKKIFKQII